MGRTKLNLVVALSIAVAGCSSPQKEAAKPAPTPKLPPGMSFGYKPPK